MEKHPNHLEYEVEQWYCGCECECRAGQVFEWYLSPNEGKKVRQVYQSPVWINDYDPVEWREYGIRMIALARKWGACNLEEIIEEYG